MLHSAPRLSAGAEDFRLIEADLEAFSPGRVAAVGVRGRAVTKGQGPGLVNVLSQREWLRVDQFQYTCG